KLAALRHAGCSILLAVDAPGRGSVLVVALPDDHELPAAIPTHSAVHLIARGGGVDPEFIAVVRAVAVEPLGVDSPTAAVLGNAGPGDDKLVGTDHRHRRVDLIARRVGVDLNLPALRDAAGIVALGAHSRVRADTR